jgi:hypothetical protein
MIHGTRAWAGLEERVAVEEGVPLAVLFDRFTLEVLPDLPATGVGVPAVRLHVKESIEPQLI